MSGPPEIWVRGYASAGECGRWLDAIERHGRPAGVGLLVSAHANKQALDPRAVRAIAQQCVALDVPYRVALTCMPDTGPNYRADSEWSLRWWADVRTWDWLAYLVRELAPLREKGDQTLTFDFEGYKTHESPWRAGASRVLEAIDALRIAEKAKGAVGRDDALLSQFVEIRTRIDSEFLRPRKEWPTSLRAKLASAMAPFIGQLHALRIEPQLTPAPLDSLVLSIIQENFPVAALDQWSYRLVRDWLLAGPDVRALLEATLRARFDLYRRHGLRLIPGFYDHLLSDLAAEARDELDFECFVFPRKSELAGLFTPDWAAGPLELQ